MTTHALQAVTEQTIVEAVTETTLCPVEGSDLLIKTVAEVRDLLAGEVDHGLDGEKAAVAQLVATLSALAQTVTGGPDFRPDPANGDRTLETRARVAAGGTIIFASGTYKLKRQPDGKPIWTTANVAAGVRLRSSGGPVVFEVEINPADLEGTVPPSIWLAYGNGPIDFGEDVSFRYSSPVTMVGEVVSRTSQSVTVKAWPGETLLSASTIDTFFTAKNDRDYGIAVRGWNRDNDDQRVPRKLPFTPNGNGTLTLDTRPVTGTVTGIVSYNPLTLTVTYDANGAPSSRDIMVLNAPGQPSLDGTIFIAAGAMAVDPDDDEGSGVLDLTTIRLRAQATGRSINASALAGSWTGAGATIVSQPIDPAKVLPGDPFGVLTRRRLGRPFVLNANADVRGTIRMANLMSAAINAKGNDRWSASIIAEDPAQLWAITGESAWLKDNATPAVLPVMRARGTGDNFFNYSGTNLARAYLAGAGTDVLKCTWTNPANVDVFAPKPKTGEALYLVKADGSRLPDMPVLGLDPMDGSAAGGVRLDVSALPGGALPADLSPTAYTIVNRTRSRAPRLLTGLDGERSMTTGSPMSGFGLTMPKMRMVGAHNATRYARPSSGWAKQAASDFGGGEIPDVEIINSGWKYRVGESALLYFDRQSSLNASSTVAESVELIRRGKVTLILSGYGGARVAGCRVMVDSLYMERLGLLRGTTPNIDNVAANDFSVGPYGELTIDRLLVPFPKLAWYCDPTGYLDVLSGSKLFTYLSNDPADPGVAFVDGATAITMPKRVRAEHADRLLVTINGIRIPPSRITADGSAVIQLASSSALSAADKVFASHEWC